MNIDYSLLKKTFHISYLRPYQQLIISNILDCHERRQEGRLLAVLPTGGGKSLCFMYPILALKAKSIIIYPLLSLMNDQEKRFMEAGIDTVVLKGGLEKEERKRRIRHIRNVKSCAVITNPETLVAMKDRSELDVLKGFDIAVVDEAHTVITWGETFRESYMELGNILEYLTPGMILAFTATADPEITRGIMRSLFMNRKTYIVHGTSDRENIFYHAIRSLSKIHDIRKILSIRDHRSAIIFVESRKMTEAIASALSGSFSIRAYHAGMDKDVKKEIEDWFMSSDNAVLAATSAYGMGMDKRDIRTVIHYSLPQSVPNFLQESGRGGRDGLRTDSYVLYYHDEKSPICSIFTGGRCIRHGLLEAMGEESAEECLGCSSCIRDETKSAGEEEILRYIRHHPFMRKDNIAKGLRSSSPLFRKRRLPEWTADEIRHALNTLIEEGHVIEIFNRLMLNRF